MRRRRRPMRLAPDESPRNEDLRILRPSEVPQREPLPDYKEPTERRIIPKNVSLDELHGVLMDPVRNVSIPAEGSIDDLLLEAKRFGEGEIFSFRTMNYVEPEDRNQVETDELHPDVDAFLKRNWHFHKKKVHGCMGFRQKSDKSVWTIVVEGPEGSLYEGCLFFTKAHFDRRNADLTPLLKFETFIFHPSLGLSGYYDLRGLTPKWSRSSTLDVLYLYLRHDLADLKNTIAKKSDHELQMMAQPNISRLASENWTRFEQIATSMCDMLAGRVLAGRHSVNLGNWKPRDDEEQGEEEEEEEEEDREIEVVNL